MIRTYSELVQYDTREERFEYLKLNGTVCHETFGSDRYLNQLLYQLDIWKDARDEVIIRDLGCDLGIEGFEIHDMIIVHHMNPITVQDIINGNPDIFDINYLIAVSKSTHRAIHYGLHLPSNDVHIIRTPNDTTPWKR